MSFSSIFGRSRSESSKQRRGKGRRGRHARLRGLRVEPLEQRQLLSAVSISADDLGGNGANDGIADVFRLVRNAADLEIYINDSLSSSVPLAGLTSVLVNGSSDQDSLIIDFSGGTFATSISFDGAALGANLTPSDSLTLMGDPRVTIGRITYGSGPFLGLDADDGGIIIDPDDNNGPGGGYPTMSGWNGDEMLIQFANLAPVYDTLPADQLDVFATQADETISIIDGPVVGGDQTATVSASTFESYSFANKTRVTVNSLNGSDTFVLNYNVAVPGLQFLDLYGNEFTGGSLNTDDAKGETFNILATGPGTLANRMHGQNGSEVFTNSDTKYLDALQSNIEMHGMAGLSVVDLSDINDPTGDEIRFEGNKIIGAAPGTIELYFATIEDIRYEATSGDDVITIVSTFSPFSYRLSGGPGSDTFRVGSYDADPGLGVSLEWAPYGTGVNTLGQIKGNLTIIPGPSGDSGTDVLYVDDSGGLMGYTSAQITDAAGGSVLARTTSLLGLDAAAPICYEYTPGASELEELYLHTSGSDDQVEISATTAGHTEINFGDGDDTVRVAGDWLSGTNDFLGGTGADTFYLDVVNDLGASAVLPFVGVTFDGGAPGPSDPPPGDTLYLPFWGDGDIDIWADKSDPAVVYIGTLVTHGVRFISIENLPAMTPTTGVVNIYGDNNDPAIDQNDVFEVIGTGPNAFRLSVNGSAPIQFTGVTKLNIWGDDQTGTASTGPNDVDSLIITPYADNTPQGWGIEISFNEGNPVDGTSVLPDPIVYNGLAGVSEDILIVPTGPGTGQLRVTNAADGSLITVINFISNSGFVINGNDGLAGDTDTLTLRGTSGNDAFAVVDADTVDLAGVYTVDLANFAVVRLEGADGTDTFAVNPSTLAVVIDGGTPDGAVQSTGDTLNIMTGGASFEVILGPEGDQGSFNLAGAGSVTFDRLEALQIDGVLYTLPDLKEPNDNVAQATVLGSLPHLTIQDLTIHTTQVGTTNDDYFQVTARDTGALLINVLFTGDGVPENLLGGALSARLLDGAGNVIGTAVATAQGVQIVAPVVSQQRYYVQVFSTDNDPNDYTLEIENFAAPAPAAAVLHPAYDTGRSESDRITAADNPVLLVQAWLSDLAAKGIPILTAAQVAAGLPGAAVEVFVNGVSAGFADPFGPSNNVFAFAMPSGLLTTGLPGGYTGNPAAFGSVNLISAAVRVFDAQVVQATGLRELGQPLSITFDPNVPDASIISLAINPASDTGAPGDGITAVAQPAFTGQAEINSIVRLYANGQLVGQAVAGSDSSDGALQNGLGTWSIVSQPLADGSYTFAITVEDVAGNITVLADSPTLGLVIDTTAPQIPTIDLQDADDTGWSDKDGVTIGDAAQGNGTVDVRVSAEYGSSVVIKDGEVVIASFVFDAAFDASDGVLDNFGVVTLSLAEGPHPLSVEATDTAGNRSQSEVLLVTVDYTAPGAAGVALAAYSDSGTVGDGITNVAAPAFHGVAEANALVRLYVDDGTGAVLAGQAYVHDDESDGNASDGLGIWEITVEPLTDGQYTVWVEVEDQAGNISDIQANLALATTITVDTASPQIPTIDLQDADDTGWSDKDGVTIGDATQGNGTVDVRVSAEYGSSVVIKDGEVVIASFVFDAAFDASDGVLDNFGVYTIDFVANQALYNIPAEGPHPLSVEATDTAGSRSQSEVLLVTIDYTAPAAPSAPDMLPDSDTGASNTDNVTRINSPAFRGTAEANSLVRIYAVNSGGQAQLVGQSLVGSDESNGIATDGLGVWEVTIEPLNDGVYTIFAEVEDQAGNISGWSGGLLIEIDTYMPNTAYLDLVTVNDSGRSNDDNVTNYNTPVFTATTSDPNAASHMFTANLRYRIYDRQESGSEVLIYDSGSLSAANSIVTPALGPLADGVHNLKLEVEDRAGNISQDFLLTVTIDTQAPPVSFGEAASVTDGLHPDSDSGLIGLPATATDRITNDTTPTVFGRAEANALVRLYADVNGNGAIDAADVFLGQTTAVPLDGNQAEPLGFWQITSSVDLNDPAIFLRDGQRTLLVQATDKAGNFSSADRLDIFLDTQAPQVEDVFITLHPEFDLFKVKPTDGPTPLISQLSIRIVDAPDGVLDWFYDVVAHDGPNEFAVDTGHFRLVGDANGIIPIAEVTLVVDPRVVGEPAWGTLVLTFAEPLPDDRFTLTISDDLRDLAGNPLDGESEAIEPHETPFFPSGDGMPGGSFVARFTVDSRPEVGVWGAGSVWIDTNGNGVFDPDNHDFTNRDIVYTLGVTSDDIFAGNFTLNPDDVADGFDKLAAYGRINGSFRWLIDVTNDGIPDISLVEPAAVNGLPVAGRFDANDANGDEVAVVMALPAAGQPSYWHFDTNHDYQVDYMLTSQLRGYPVVGDFDGDGFDDLATWMDDTFYIDLAQGVRCGWDGVADATFHFGLIGVRERPVAADFDQDGFDDLGLWVPDRSGQDPAETGEFYILVSGGESLLDRIVTDPIKGYPKIDFTPTPFGDDLYIQFGDEFAVPVVGNFDPPVAPQSLTVTATLSGTDNDDVLEFVAGDTAANWVVKLNGVVQTFDSATTELTVDLGGGSDRVIFTGTAGEDLLELSPSGLIFSGQGYRLSVSGAEVLVADAAAGQDQATFLDGSGDDTFTAAGGTARLVATGYDLQVQGVENVVATATAGGTDIATLYDSPGNDQGQITPTGAVLSGEGFRFEAQGFTFTHLVSKNGGNDFAQFTGTNGADAFVARPNYSTMTIAGTGAFYRAKAFSQVEFNAPAGNEGVIKFVDGAGDDTFTANPTTAVLQGNGYQITSHHVAYVHAYARYGGVDTASLTGSEGDDRMVVDSQFLKIYGDGYLLRAKGFELATADALAGNDSAKVLDSLGDDTLIAEPNRFELQTRKQNFQGFGIETLDARSVYGGVDTAKLYDSALDDVFTASPTRASLVGAGYGMTVQAYDYVHAYSRSGTDVASLTGSSGNDQFVSSPGLGVLSGEGFYLRAKNFSDVQVNSGGGKDTARLDASATVDAIFANGTDFGLEGLTFKFGLKSFSQVQINGVGKNDTAEVWNGQIWHQEFDLNGNPLPQPSATATLILNNISQVRTRSETPPQDDTLDGLSQSLKFYW